MKCFAIWWIKIHVSKIIKNEMSYHIIKMQYVYPHFERFPT